MNCINMLKIFGINSKLKNMADYHDLHLISDILLLTDVMKISEKLAYNIFDLILVIFHITWIILGCYAKNDRSQTRIDD